MLMEFGAFMAIGLIAGRCGMTQAAGHAIVQCLTDMSYVLPLGIGALGSIKVGQGVGGGDGREAQRAARTSMLNGVYGVAINAAHLRRIRETNLLVVHVDPAVHAVAVSILPVVAAYQAADGLRVVSAGCLRGVGRLNAALVSDVVGFWILDPKSGSTSRCRGHERHGDMAGVRVWGDRGDDADIVEGLERGEQAGEAAGRHRVMMTKPGVTLYYPSQLLVKK